MDFLSPVWIVITGMVRRRHIYVGAPDNRIKSLWENVLTPQGKDMILELGLVVAVSPQTTYQDFEVLARDLARTMGPEFRKYLLIYL